MTASTVTLENAAGPETRSASTGMTTGAVRNWLRIEALAAFVAALAFFGAIGGNRLLVVSLLLFPHGSAAGYLPRAGTGAVIVNPGQHWSPGLGAPGLPVALPRPPTRSSRRVASCSKQAASTPSRCLRWQSG